VTLQHILLGFIVSFWFPVSRALTEPTALAQHAEDTG
jgi:hypothetical protein